jgi:AraC-like DNA-binding protein
MSQTALPNIRFDTAGLAAADQFEAWRDAVGVTHEITSPDSVKSVGITAASDIWRLGDLVLSYRRFPRLHFDRSKRRAQVDGLDHYSLLFMREGTWEGDADGHEVRTAAGQVCMFDLAQPVTNWVSENASLRVMIPRDQLDAVVPPGQIHGLVLHGSAGALLSGYLDVLLRQLDQLAPTDAPYVARATRDIVAACLVPSRDRAERAAAPIAATQLHAVRQYIEANLASPDLAATKICRAVGLSRTTLYRLFERFGGVADYIQTRRLARVRALLVDPRETRRISELAYAHGFTSDTRFSKAFHRAYGATPRDVRAATGRSEWIGQTEPGPVYRTWVRGG